MLEKKTKDGILACWRSRLKREYLLVGGEGIFACWRSRLKREYLLVCEAD